MTWHWLERHRAVGPLVALVVLYGVFAAAQPDTFATLGNLRTMVRQTSVVGMGALGMTLVIVLGGIDLSIGSIVAFVTVAIAWLLQAGWSPLPAATAGIPVGGCCGLANGALVTGLRVSPFIVTLGAMGIIRGAAKGLADEQKIDAPITWLNGLVAELPRSQSWILFPPGVWLTIAMAAGAVVLLGYTRFGRHIVAVGSNEAAARLCGVRVRRVKISVYAIEGLLAGAAGLMQFSGLTVGDPTAPGDDHGRDHRRRGRAGSAAAPADRRLNPHRRHCIAETQPLAHQRPLRLAGITQARVTLDRASTGQARCAAAGLRRRRWSLRVLCVLSVVARRGHDPSGTCPAPRGRRAVISGQWPVCHARSTDH